MTHLKKGSWLAFFILVIIAVIAFSLDKEPSEQSLLGITEVEVSDQVIDLKTILKSHKAIVFFSIYNTGTQPLKLDRVSTSCHCTLVNFKSDIVLPADSTFIIVEYDKRNQGFFYQNIQVYGNFKGSPMDLGIKGFVEVTD